MAVQEQQSPEQRSYGNVFRHENRAYERVFLHVPGQLFDPVTEQTVPCQVLNLSPDGAGLACAAGFAQGVPLVLYIEGFGRFEGTVIEHRVDLGMAQEKLGLAFSLSHAKRARVSDMLSLFVREGLKGVTQLRQARRIRVNGVVEVLLPDGRNLSCEIVDISLDGVSLRTTERPPLGEILNMGHTRGQVARHHDHGIALKFVRDAA